MSRSNGPISQVRGVPPQQWQLPADQDAASPQAYGVAAQPVPGRYPQQPGLNPDAGQYQPAPYAQQSQPPGQQYSQGPTPSAPQQGYYQPQQTPSYQPVFDRYAAPPEPTAPSYDPRAQQQRPAPAPAYAPQPQQPSLYDTRMAQAQVPGQRPGPYDQWPQASPAPLPPLAQLQAPSQAAQAQPAQRGYDFSNYAPPIAPPQPIQDYDARDYGAAPAQMPYQGRQPDMQQPLRADDAQWQLNAGFDTGERQQQQVGYDQQGYAADDQGQQLQAAGEQPYDTDDQGEYEDEPPRKSRRGLMMVSALVGAIALGGGMAYGYKTYMKPGEPGKVGSVKAPNSPAKTQPTDAGGMKFPNQSSKLAGRLEDGSAPASATLGAAATAPSSASAAAADPDGVKRVATVVVGRDGSIAPPPAPPMGMVVERPAAPRLPQAQPDLPAAVPPQRTRTAELQPQAAPQPKAPLAVVNQAPGEATPAPPKVVKQAPPKKQPAARDDLASNTAAPAAGAAAPAAKAGGTGGFVAVLASKPSRAEAERANAEFEQKFDVLKGKVFDVQEADLTSQGKGVVYRSVVGPPGSRAFAAGVCSDLKAVGYAGCWATAY
jgi:hypothetical protein